MPEAVDREFFTRPSHVVARDLIGMRLFTVRDGICGGRIVEVEAYGDATDLASHTAVYPKARAHLLAVNPGVLYVYRSYGIHLCLNIVAHEPGTSGAILIRAIEPTEGVGLLQNRRPNIPDARLLSGPGNVTTGLAIRLEDTGGDLLAGFPLRIESADSTVDVIATTRIGITRDVDRPWRFIEARSPFVSGPRRLARASL